MAEGEGGVREGRGREKADQPGLRLIKEKALTGKQAAKLLSRGFPGGSDGKETACNVGDPGLIPGLGFPGAGNG